MINITHLPIKDLDREKIKGLYGQRTHPITKRADFHNGIDILYPAGTKLHAIANGKVLISQFHTALGWYVVIEHKGFLTVYAHLSKKGAAQGAQLNGGDTIGYLGSTGASTGPHLHFEIREGSYGDNKVFWDRGISGAGKYPNSIDPLEILMNIAKPKTEIEQLVNDMIACEIITSAGHWLKVLNKEISANPDYLKSAFKNAIKKIKK
jgi:murein DD-endopeptidase MepM/ murein hydrolase activator NlpD